MLFPGCEWLQKLDLTVNFVGDLLSIESLLSNEHLHEMYVSEEYILPLSSPVLGKHLTRIIILIHCVNHMHMQAVTKFLRHQMVEVNQTACLNIPIL